MRRIAFSTVLLSLFVSPNAIPQVPPPPALRGPVVARSVTLTGEDPTTLMRRQRILRQFPLAQLQAQPRIALGSARANLAPLLANPVSTFNIAQKLRALPQHVRVNSELTLISEIEQGLVIHTQLSYRILPGKCRDATVRGQLAAAGISCFTAQAPSARIAAFANPRDSRYVADPARRAQAVRAYQEALSRSQASNNKRIADLRRALADPQQRGKYVATLGAAEVQRLSALGDEQLKEEIITSGTTEIEQVLFVPKIDSLELTPGIKAMQTRLGPKPAPTLPPMRPLPGAKATQVHGPFIYLTGFTFGKDYEWRKRVQTTVKWCLIGCDETYYIEPYAGFNYGFGLRFPIRATLTYEFEWRAERTPNGVAQVKVDFSPIDGSAQDFASSGLSPSRIFDGKELVAQAGANAGVNYRLPFVPGSNVPFARNIDLTDGMLPPFTHGQFPPPPPGAQPLNAEIIFGGPDLIGGLANFGVAGAAVLPAVRVALHSNALQFTLVDKVTNAKTTVDQSGKFWPIGVNNDNVQSSQYSFGNPVYQLGFSVTPGIDVRMFIDIEVWSDHWDWTVWLPQLEVDLPPGGADFACHDGTICSRDFSDLGLPNPAVKDMKKALPYMQNK